MMQSFGIGRNRENAYKFIINKKNKIRNIIMKKQFIWTKNVKKTQAKQGEK
jgi:hypothetical protein